jgi:hypothetical protein
MALFLRREVQRRIDEASAFLDKEKLQGLVRRLNLPNKASIEAQWELMWLTAFARLGELRHEVAHPDGTRFPDVHYKTDEVEFVADITTASDCGYDADNPIEEFRRAINHLYRKYKTKGGFTLGIESRMVGKFGDRKVKLLLPTKSRLTKFVAEHFEPFVASVMTSPEAAGHCSAAIDGGAIVLTYDPKRRPLNHDTGHLSFNVPYSLTRNPVYNVLKSKKPQLKKSGYKGLKGVIIGDASCNILNTSMVSGSAFSLSDIVLGFLGETQSIDFVLTVGVEERSSMSWNREIRFKPALFFQRKMSEATGKTLEKALSRVLSQIPIPERPGYSAIYKLERGSPPDAWSGAIAASFTLPRFMEPSEIRVSSRLLAGLLSGKITPAEFRSVHEIRGNTGKPPVCLFEQFVREGRMITEAKVEPHSDRDDDHVVLVFGPPDPAASRFRTPMIQKS